MVKISKNLTVYQNPGIDQQYFNSKLCKNVINNNCIIYIYKRLGPRKKNPQQKKRKSRKSNFFMKLNTKPLKFKYRLVGEGGRGPGGQAGRPMQGMGTPT